VRTKICLTTQKECAIIVITQQGDQAMQTIVNTEKKRTMQKVYASIAISIVIVKQENK
jgi:hypothetical protein